MRNCLKLGRVLRRFAETDKQKSTMVIAERPYSSVKSKIGINFFFVHHFGDGRLWRNLCRGDGHEIFDNFRGALVRLSPVRKGGNGSIGILTERDVNQGLTNKRRPALTSLRNSGLKFAPSRRFTSLKSASIPSSGLRVA